MSVVSGVTEFADLIPEIWSSQMYDQLRSKIIFANIFSKQFEGEIRAMGDVVRVNTVNAPTGEILTDDKQVFASEALSTSQNTITVNKRASAALEITDTAQLQSQEFESELQNSLVYAVYKQLESDIIAALIPSASSPDHIIAPASASDLAAADVAGIRTLLSQALVPTSNRFLVIDPAYYGDILLKSQLASRDYRPNTTSTVSGAISDLFYGFNIIEHDGLSADTGYGVHTSALQLVMQRGLRVKVSDLHSQRKYGYLISVDFLYGFSLFDNTRIVKISG